MVLWSFNSMGLAVAAPIAALAAADTTGYWQQQVHYEIVARLDEPSGVLSGRERIVYINHSPDTLRQFYLHLYLNAFRPGSRWADRDSIEGRRRFNDLQDPDYAFNHASDVRVNGDPVAGEYPYAPDSTVVRFPLPAPLSPGDSAVVEMQWDARPSTVPRRQGRRGRRFDFAQWYPRVVVYDRYGWQDHPLYPAGEFYGEFGTFDVTLDVPEDQVIGATGVPVEGDPGWERRKADPTVEVDYQREWYRSRLPASQRERSGERGAGPGCAAVELPAGRKCVRFYAEDVHHFAMSLNPDYVYEEGRYGDVVVRVLYLPRDSASWGNGVAVRRTEEALRWLDGLFGPFPWPQLTNVHRIEGGGTEFPMMVMDGSAGLGLILHEVGHNYLMGILANNEWKEGFLDEGFSSFQSAWYFEEHVSGFDPYPGIERFILDLDLDGWSEPVSMVSEDYRDFSTYGAMIYTKAQLFYLQLRYIVGHETMRQILREYYRRWKLKHVTETALLEVAEDVSGMELEWFFSQWLHGAPIYDYAIGKVRRQESADGTWQTSVEVRRKGSGLMPVEIGEQGSGERGAVVYARASGRPEQEVVTFRTAEKPGRLMLDPRLMTHDWNYLNNRERRFFDFRGAAWRFDTFVREPSRRDRPVNSIAPTLWYNDAAEFTVGVRWRWNYLGRFERGMLWVTRGTTGDEPTTFRDHRLYDAYAKLENLVWLRRPHTSHSLEAWYMEGRTGGRLTWEWEHRRSWSHPGRQRRGVSAMWMATRNTAFVDPALWDDGGTAELSHYVEWDAPSGATDWKLRLDIGGGIAYAARDVGVRLDRQYDVEPFGRVTASIAVRRSLSGGAWVFGARLFAGGYVAENPPFRQRAIQVSGADPYQRFGNPMIRSLGAALVRPEIFYHAPGQGNLRGYAPGLGGRWLGALNLELERMVVRRSSGLLRSASVVVFGDGALADSLAVPSAGGDFLTPLFDAGVGVRFRWRLGDLSFPLRVEVPLVVARSLFAHNTRQGTDTFEFRWLISLEPIF
ncbi:MAG: hypothetical protein GTN62_03210 [Gemmatimonadales bacterium]|nr:hypothetical protein [Gemmatimonadales bacterium]NIN49109.1 hypothetical protein [Gemmatimonadales bacterium]NIP06573.1 hypothetical protein [Gemmatimonadales bacterium]NIR00270.1 hypothetical protein [Gemmatimonadales bacterium]NIS64603.1 hypothetical protein [Gemmatimonadales bacterium]